MVTKDIYNFVNGKREFIAITIAKFDRSKTQFKISKNGNLFGYDISTGEWSQCDQYINLSKFEVVGMYSTIEKNSTMALVIEANMDFTLPIVILEKTK